MFRSGEGAGVTGVILSKGSADIYSPKVIRSTMGSIFRMPFIYVDNLPDMVKKLGNYGISTYAAHLKGKKNYDEFDYTKPTAFLIGNEGNGLTKETADAATDYVLIPMKGEVESMNAATSSAILTFEASRQRRS
jgi:TrmH family RNA methyltransferase